MDDVVSLAVSARVWIVEAAVKKAATRPNTAPVAAVAAAVERAISSCGASMTRTPANPRMTADHR